MKGKMIFRALFCTLSISSHKHLSDEQYSKMIFFFIFYRLHYITSTNCGLCQGNMTWCYEVRGPNYHWITDLYERLNLPVVPAVARALQKAVEDRRKVLEGQKADRAKKNRINMKVARSEDQTARKKWLKRQAVQHTYGNDDDQDGEVDQETVRGARAADGNVTIISGKT